VAEVEILLRRRSGPFGFGAGRKETRLALAAAAVAVPEGLSQIRELCAQACPLPRVSAQRSPPPRTYWAGIGAGDLILALPSG
jgi:hypothetical protein